MEASNDLPGTHTNRRSRSLGGSLMLHWPGPIVYMRRLKQSRMTRFCFKELCPMMPGTSELGKNWTCKFRELRISSVLYALVDANAEFGIEHGGLRA